jgi:hypothetical protein
MTRGTRVRSINAPAADPCSHARGARVTVRFDPIKSIDIIGSYQHYLSRGHFFDQVETANLATGGTPVGTLIDAFDRLAVQDAPRTVSQDYNVWNIEPQWKFAGQKLQRRERMALRKGEKSCLQPAPPLPALS